MTLQDSFQYCFILCYKVFYMKLHNNMKQILQHASELDAARAIALAEDIARLMPDAAVFIVDRDRRLQFWSEGAEQLLGYKQQDMLGQTCLAGNRCIECLDGCGISQQTVIKGKLLNLKTAVGNVQRVKKYALGFRDSDGLFDGGIEILLGESIAETTSSSGMTDDMVFHGLVGTSPEMRAAFDLIMRVAVTEMPVLIRGESGTGKELAARAIHAESARKNGPFVALNCATLTANFLETELFGHVRGAFTGAVRDHRGVFERAQGGTLFLDEVAELPIELQARLLRVLETGEFTPLGAEKTQQADVRIVTATHRALREEARSGRFREDLLYRLRVVPIFLPPLRERLNDIPLLVHHLLEQPIETEALQALTAYSWPGNVRELRNALQYAKVMAGKSSIGLRHLPPEIALKQSQLKNPAAALIGHPKPRRPTSAEIAMAAAEGSQKLEALAASYGISRTTLWRWRKKQAGNSR